MIESGFLLGLPDLLSWGSAWICKYGNVALFFLLVLGIVGLPIPDETLLVFVGFLVSKGKLSPISTPIAAVAGSIFGITISYLIGLFTEKFILKKYGPWVGITEAKIDRVHNWFKKIGKWVLFVGYFIPGVRHLSGFVAGTARMEYKHFALFAYAGAIIWANLFLLIGYFSGNFM